MNRFLRQISSLLLLVLVLITFFLLSKGYSLPLYSTYQEYTEDSWKFYKNEELINENATLPFRIKADGTNRYTLISTITYNPIPGHDVPCVFVPLNHMYTRIYLDGKEIYTYTKNNTPHYTKSPGNVYAIIPLGDDCTGKELHVDMFPTLRQGVTYTINPITFGDYSTIMRHTFISDLPRNCLTVAILFCGILLVLTSLGLCKTGLGRELWFIGIFALLFSIYNASESLFNIYIVSNPYFMHLINFFIFAMIPIPLLRFYQERIGHKLETAYNIMYCLMFSNLVAQAVLHFTNIQDVRQMLPATHLIYAGAFVLIPFSIFTISDKKRKRFLSIETLALAIGALADAIGFYFGIRFFSSNTAAIQAAVLTVLLMEGYDVFATVKSTYKENIKSVFYKELAYKDALTKLENRVAFNEEVEAISAGVRHFNSLTCLSVDVNGLKSVNDKLGHLAGDTLIQSTADFLQEYFSEHGRIFRTGGDEFMLFLYDISDEILLTTLHEMQAAIAAHNEHREIPLSFAIGYCDYDGGNLEECIRKADLNMYKHKDESRTDGYTPRIPSVIEAEGSASIS